MAVGLYKEIGGWGTEDSARVRYSNGRELDKPCSSYEADDDQPVFDSLPTKTQYAATHALK